MSHNAFLKKLIYNPVLSGPWNRQPNKVYGDPAIFIQLQANNLQYKKSKPSSKDQRRRFKRIKNLNTLLKRYTGLKKSKARAALYITGHKLDGAIVILETARCWQPEVDSNQMLNIKDISIELEYSLEETDLSSRSIYWENNSALIADSAGSSKCTESHQRARKVQKVKPSLRGQKRREREIIKNVNTLLKIFPGLKKCKAKAALTIAGNKLAAANIILKLARCYQKKTNKCQIYGRHLKNIYIDMQFQRGNKKTLRRNVNKNKPCLQSKNKYGLCDTNNNSSAKNSDNNNKTENRQISKVDVIITKRFNNH